MGPAGEREPIATTGRFRGEECGRRGAGCGRPFRDTPGMRAGDQGCAEHLVPVTKKQLRSIDNDARSIVVDWPRTSDTTHANQVVTTVSELIRAARSFGVLVARGARTGDRWVAKIRAITVTTYTARWTIGRMAAGTGMVLKPEPMSKAVDGAAARLPAGRRGCICRRRACHSAGAARNFEAARARARGGAIRGTRRGVIESG